MNVIDIIFVSRYARGELSSKEKLDLKTGIVIIETPVCMADLQHYGRLEEEYVAFEGRRFDIVIDVKFSGSARVTDAGLNDIRKLVKEKSMSVKAEAAKMQKDLIKFLKSNNLSVSSKLKEFVLGSDKPKSVI